MGNVSPVCMMNDEQDSVYRCSGSNSDYRVISHPFLGDRIFPSNILGILTQPYFKTLHQEC